MKMLKKTRKTKRKGRRGMRLNEINIRDPFVLNEDGTYYMYGTRGAGFGVNTGGFDVYMSADLEEWSGPHECFNSTLYGMNRGANWAPEVHAYKGAYYMFATFLQLDGLRGTYILRSDSPLGPFEPHSTGAVTPGGWECLDGTLYVEDGVPYLVFCHEHTQITDGGMCYIKLRDDLTISEGEPVTLFHASEPHYVNDVEKRKKDGDHFVTDGPFMYRTDTGELLMLWSTFICGQYAECQVLFEGGTIKGNFRHLDPIADEDGGHGMLFRAENQLYLTYHTPNASTKERPVFIKVRDTGKSIEKE